MTLKLQWARKQVRVGGRHTDGGAKAGKSNNRTVKREAPFEIFPKNDMTARG